MLRAGVSVAISSDILRGFVAVLGERGVTLAELLREAKVDGQLLSRGSRELSVGDAVSLIAAGYRLSRDPALALRVGSQAPLQSLGTLGALVAYCPTLRCCIGEAATYLHLVLPMAALRLIEEQDQARLVLELPFADPHILRTTTELSLTFAVRIGRRFYASCEGPTEVAIGYPTPHYAQAYSDVLGCPVRFDAKQTEIVLPAIHLDEPQLFVDDSLYRLFKRRADDLITHGRTNLLLQERVRHALRHQLDLHEVTPKAVARQLGMTVRRLRYCLAEEGRTLVGLIDEARRETSLKEIGDMSIKGVADRVGFSQVSAFQRAFKRWTGTTPARYRMQQAGARSR
ncbi:MAG TPA: AraC family transcriptional regulator ligand-binding domain-containing protein [Polyangiales bacterium]